MKRVRLLIVDDSAVIRKLLEKVMSTSPEIEVVGMAPDPYVAREMIAKLKPDVMTLDIEMPKMDGISFLEKVMQHFPIPTIIFSSLTKTGSETYFRALEAGAVEVLEKPSIDVSRGFEPLAKSLVEKVLWVARAKIQPRVPKLALSPGGVVKKSLALERTTHQIVAIASSTGGTDALKRYLSGLPANIPGTLIVQHMPPGFTKTFAENLNKQFSFEVKEAEQGERVIPGKVIIAPGNFHMEIVRKGGYYHVELHQKPPLHNVRPAADYLLKSVAQNVGKNAIGIVLTGMGKDGAEGLAEMKRAGAFTMAQDEASCVVFGMPAAAIATGAVDLVLSLSDMAAEVMNQIRRREAA